MKNLILEIQNQFIEALQAKNGWGKNEVKELYLAISNKVMAEYIQEKREFFAKQYGGRMSSGPYENDPTMGGQQLSKELDRKGRDIDPLLNSAHGFTEGADIDDNPFKD